MNVSHLHSCANSSKQDRKRTLGKTLTTGREMVIRARMQAALLVVLEVDLDVQVGLTAGWRGLCSRQLWKECLLK